MSEIVGMPLTSVLVLHNGKGEARRIFVDERPVPARPSTDLFRLLLLLIDRSIRQKWLSLNEAVLRMECDPGLIKSRRQTLKARIYDIRRLARRSGTPQTGRSGTPQMKGADFIESRREPGGDHEYRMNALIAFQEMEEN